MADIAQEQYFRVSLLSTKVKSTYTTGGGLLGFNL